MIVKYLVIFLLSLNIYSQNLDNLIIKHNDTIKCKIDEIRKNKIYYKINNQQFNINLDDVLDIKLEQTKNIFVLQKPLAGKSLIYIYRPHEVVNMLVNLNITCNGEQLIKLKNNSYFIQEVEAGTFEYKGKFCIRGNLDSMKLEVKEGKIYFLQVAKLVVFSVDHLL